jgi:hypothetical protein
MLVSSSNILNFCHDFFPLLFILLFPFLLECLLCYSTFFLSYNPFRHWQNKYYINRDDTEPAEKKIVRKNGRRTKAVGKELGGAKGERAWEQRGGEKGDTGRNIAITKLF